VREKHGARQGAPGKPSVGPPSNKGSQAAGLQTASGDSEEKALGSDGQTASAQSAKSAPRPPSLAHFTGLPETGYDTSGQEKGLKSMWAIIAIARDWFSARKNVAATTLAALMLFAIGIAWYVWSITVYEPFVSIYNIHRNLGKPITHQQTTAVYFAKYEQGIVIYLPIPNIHYVLPRDQVNRTVLVSSVIQKIPNGSPYFKDDFVRQRLKILTNKRPPIGGIAVEWEKNPKQWEWLGGREWQLAVESPQDYIQYFEGGIIIGPLPDSFELNTGWLVYAVLDYAHKWAQEVTQLTLSKPYRLER
jgi:hypothetical protein